MLPDGKGEAEFGINPANTAQDELFDKITLRLTDEQAAKIKPGATYFVEIAEKQEGNRYISGATEQERIHMQATVQRLESSWLMKEKSAHRDAAEEYLSVLNELHAKSVESDI